MTARTIHLVYWVVTGSFALLLLMAGVVEAMQVESGREIMQHLGYPEHVLLLLGVGKIAAAVAFVQPKYRTIKEWAYAGVTFNLIGAFAARAYAGDSLGLILSPLIFLSIMFLPYFLWKQVAIHKQSAKRAPDGAKSPTPTMLQPKMIPGLR